MDNRELLEDLWIPKDDVSEESADYLLCFVRRRERLVHMACGLCWLEWFQVTTPV